MNQDQYSEAVEALVFFVIRVSKGKATPEEIKALPEVAKALLSTWSAS